MEPEHELNLVESYTSKPRISKKKTSHILKLPTRICAPPKNVFLNIGQKISFHHSKKQQLPCNCVFFLKSPDDSPSNFRGQKVPHVLFHQKIPPEFAAARRSGVAGGSLSSPPGGLQGWGQPNIPWKHVFFQAWVLKRLKKHRKLRKCWRKFRKHGGVELGFFFCPSTKRKRMFIFPILLNFFCWR